MITLCTKLSFAPIALACVIATPPAVVMAAMPTAPSSSPAAEDATLARRLRVEVDPGIEDAALIPDWVAGRSSHRVRALEGSGEQEQWLAVEIRGSTYDYRVTVVAMRGGKPVASSDPTPCECNDEELLTLVDQHIATIVGSLAKEPRDDSGGDDTTGEGSTTTSPTLPAPTGAGSNDRSLDRIGRPSIGALGYAGIGLGVAGIGMLAAGIPLALQHDRVRGDPGAIQLRSTHDAGIGVAVAGGVALLGGVALTVVDVARSRKRSIAVVPTAGRGHVGMTFTWRL